MRLRRLSSHLSGRRATPLTVPEPVPEVIQVTSGSLEVTQGNVGPRNLPKTFAVVPGQRTTRDSLGHSLQRKAAFAQRGGGTMRSLSEALRKTSSIDPPTPPQIDQETSPNTT